MRDKILSGEYSFNKVKQLYDRGYIFDDDNSFHRSKFVLECLRFLARNRFTNPDIKDRFERDLENYILTHEHHEDKNRFELTSIRNFLGKRRYDTWVEDYSDLQPITNSNTGYLYFRE